MFFLQGTLNFFEPIKRFLSRASASRRLNHFNKLQGIESSTILSLKLHKRKTYIIKTVKCEYKQQQSRVPIFDKKHKQTILFIDDP